MPRNDPNEYIDGFNWKTVVGAFFVGIVMMPASIYISLFAGRGLGPAAEWVTIILFAELARRSISSLKKQEVYVLYYVAAGLAGGGVFSGLIWNQYLRQSREAAAFGVAQGMPLWAAPAASSPGILDRALWHKDWLPAIMVVMIGQVLIRLNWFGLGYALFRLTSDVERLPFPLSAVAAEGATALAESPEKKDSWRWQIFSMGSMIGLVFGVVYIGVPAVTSLIFAAPISLFPIPWADFTVTGENILPSALLNVSFDVGTVMWGMVLPFWAVVGQFTMTVATSIIGNPVLQKLGMFPTWKKGMGVISTQLATGFDFWISFGAGAALAVACIGLWHLIKLFSRRGVKGDGALPASEQDIILGKEGSSSLAGSAGKRGSWTPPKGRGDFPVWVAMTMFLISTFGFVQVCHVLVPKFPYALLLFYGFIYTPLSSYISARMIGLTGNGVGFPFIREGSFMMSGYKGVDIWFAPIPLNDYGGVPQLFKQLELTRTKFTSIIKAELLMFPISVVFSFVFWAFMWHLTAIPSYSFPWVNKLWPFDAITGSLFMTATSEGRSWLLEALKLKFIVAGTVGGIGLYALVTALQWPVFLFYGAMGGIGAMPNGSILLIIGAVLGRYYFAPKYGEDKWFRYAPVLGAGFAAGVGLIGMLAVGITMVTGSTVTKPF